MSNQRPPGAPSHLLLLLRLQSRVALRGMPCGWAAWARLLLGGALVLALLGPSIASWYARETVYLAHLFLRSPRGQAGAATLLARDAALASAAVLILDSIAYAQVVHHPDMETLARTPLAPRTILAARVCASYATVAPLLLAAALPLVVGLDRALGLGWGALGAALALLLLLPLLPIAGAALLAVILLRLVPASRARGLTAFLAPLLVCGAGVASTLQGHAANEAGGDAGIVVWVGVAWTDSPLAWAGRALAAVATSQPSLALLTAGGTAALALAVGGLAAILARDLFAAGVVAYRGAPGRARRPRVRGPRGASTTVSLNAVDVARTPAPAAPRRSRVAAAWRPLLGKEWRLSRRDGTTRGRLIFGLVGVTVAFSSGMELAGTRGGEAPSIAAVGAGAAGAAGAIAAALVAAATSAAFYILLLFSVGGLLSALLEAAWAREAEAREVLARSPLPLRRALLALGAFYAVPGVVCAVVLAAVGTLLLGHSAVDILLAAPALAGGLAMLCGATLAASAVWPARNASTTLVPHSWRARLAIGAADTLVSIACDVPLTLALALAGARQPALALAVALVPLGLAAVLLALCLRVATRGLDRLFTGAR